MFSLLLASLFSFLYDIALEVRMSSIKLFRSLLMQLKFRPVYASDSIVAVASLKRQNFFVCSFGSFLLCNSQYESCRKVVTRICNL